MPKLSYGQNQSHFEMEVASLVRPKDNSQSVGCIEVGDKKYKNSE